ncbi:MAG TPA: sigma factor [bacterium]|jgi:DNA-directed RNA polymerase specialized sigma24 family protein
MSIHSTSNPDGRGDWEALLKRAQRDDVSAVTELLSNLAVTLRPIVQYRLRGWSRQDHDDILQETLITFARKLKQIESTPQHYAAGILRNKIGDALRSRERRSEISRSDEAAEASPVWRHEVEIALRQQNPEEDLLGQIDNDELIERIRRAVSKLSLFCQAFFVGILEGQNMADLWELFKAAEPNLERNAFRKRIFACRLKLKALLQEAI